MTDVNDIVIVGGGLAAAKAVEAVREEGFDGRVTLFAEESELPYERPPLSKGYLVGDASPHDVLVHPAAYYAQHDIDVRLGTPISEIDRSGAQVVAADGSRRRYDALLLATGAQPRTLPGPPLSGVHTLRTKRDSEELQKALRGGGHVVVIGGGWIGCEVASSARRLGAEVTVVEPLDTPLQRVLGTEIGQVFVALHRDNGVDLRLGLGVSSLRGDDRVEGVSLTDETVVDADLVVVGIGVVPRTELAESAGLAIDNGILTDATLRTSDDHIYAAGDVARSRHPLYDEPLRVEHWANALNQGTTAGRNLLGAGAVYDRMPYFYSDQYDLGLEYVGYAADWDEVVVRGDLDQRSFIAFWVTAGRVVAAMSCNIWDVVDDLKALISSRAVVDAATLRAADIPLASLIPNGAG